jgi:hypothetical protein
VLGAHDDVRVMLRGKLRSWSRGGRAHLDDVWDDTDDAQGNNARGTREGRRDQTVDRVVFQCQECLRIDLGRVRGIQLGEWIRILTLRNSSPGLDSPHWPHPRISSSSASVRRRIASH